MASCEECRFYRQIPKGNVTCGGDHNFTVGTCHRHAPLPASDMRLAVWPSVQTHEWCGDFEDAGKKSVTQASSSVAQTLRDMALPAAVQTLSMIKSYLEEAIGDFDEDCFVVQRQERENGLWRVEVDYDSNKYNFVIGPDGIREVT